MSFSNGVENIEILPGRTVELALVNSPSAEENRSNLREVYADVLGLMPTAAIPTDTYIAFHVSEGLANLARKMQGALGQPYHQLWAAAEELRFLFDAHAVWIGVPKDYRQAPQDADEGEIVWEVATLTEEEKALLEPVFDGTFAERRERREGPHVRWDILSQPLGKYEKGYLNNSNLISVDGLLVIDIVPLGLGTPWRLAAFMEHYTLGRETIRESTRVCEAILPAAPAPPQTEPLLRALARLTLPFGPVGSLDRKQLDFWPVDRQGFKRESDRFQDSPKMFCELYRERFRPIHTILERIYDQMDALLAGERGAETTLIFSYRPPGDDSICFFPTARQADSFVHSKEEIADFLYFWQFPYYRSKAISGWVLATGTCDYTEEFDADGRWTKWISHCSDTEQPKIKKQLALVRKFFKTEQGDEPKFMYLVPIVLRPGYGVGGAKANSAQLQPILMASIASSKPMGQPLRQQLYDLAWQIAPAVEMALLAQMTQEEVYKLKLEVAKAKLRTKEADRRVSLSGWLGHTLPKFIFKPLEFYIQKVYINLKSPEKLLKDYEALSFFNSKGQTEFKWFLDFNIARTPDPSGVPTGSCSIGDVISDVKEIHAKSKDLAVAGRFDRWDSRKDGRLLREVAESSILLDVETLRHSTIEIMGSKESHVIALWNMIDNALDSFEWNLLNGAGESRFSIKIEGTTVDHRFRLRISNNGQEIKPNVAILLRDLLEAAYSDEPDTVRFKESQGSADEVMEELRKNLNNKENPGQGLYRTARFLHDLSPAYPGCIEFDRQGEWTVFDLHIPQYP